MSETQTLEFKRTINAPVVQVFNAFSSSVALQSWFADFAEIAFTEEGRVYFWWNAGYYASGLVTKIDPEKHFGFTWSGLGEPSTTQVDVYFAEMDQGTEVTIQHSQIGTDKVWSERIAQYKTGWETGLDNLKSVLETGLDKRIFDRPMLGIYLGGLLDEKQAEELGVPVTAGVRLSGVLEGMGAQAAGLTIDDVVVSLNEHEIAGYQDFAPALNGAKAGDVVEVVFYRGSEKHTVQMELSRRQAPDIPNTAGEMADAAAETYKTVAEERTALFTDVSEQEASAPPEEGEWSAKEVLAHLLYSERWLHMAISCAVDGQRAGGFFNQHGLISALANAYTLKDLLAELDRSEAVTIAALRALPDEFVADKRLFIGFLIGNQGFDIHARTHFDQIRNALETARKEK